MLKRLAKIMLKKWKLFLKVHYSRICITFFDVSLHLNDKWVCPSVLQSVRPSVTPVENPPRGASNGQYWLLLISIHCRESETGPEIYNRENLGVFKVAAVHSTFLIDLRNSEAAHLSFKPDPRIYDGRPLYDE